MSAFFPPHFGENPIFFPINACFGQEEEEASDGEGSNEVTWWLEATSARKKPPPESHPKIFGNAPSIFRRKGQPQKVLGKGVWTSLREPFFSGEDGVSFRVCTLERGTDTYPLAIRLFWVDDVPFTLWWVLGSFPGGYTHRWLRCLYSDNCRCCYLMIFIHIADIDSDWF